MSFSGSHFLEEDENAEKLQKEVLSLLKEDDPYRKSRQIQLEFWCEAYRELFNGNQDEKFKLVSDILADEESWEKTDTIHGIRLNRTKVGRKMIWKPNPAEKKKNPFSVYEQCLVACCCCFDDVIMDLFKELKGTEGMEWFRIWSANRFFSHELVDYWSRVLQGNASKLKSKGKHFYEYGLNTAIGARIGYVEAVQFFWNKIKLLPQEELSAPKKDIFMKTTVRASGISPPEVFEFCLNQMSPVEYPELIRELPFSAYYSYRCLNSLLKDTLCFDQFQRLFDCMRPRAVLEKAYRVWLRYAAKTEGYTKCYVDAAVKLFMHMWMKVGYDSHRASFLNYEMIHCDNDEKRVLKPLVRQGSMKLVWAVLDKASPDQIKAFMSSESANYIRSVLKERKDSGSLSKFLAYGSPV